MSCTRLDWARRVHESVLWVLQGIVWETPQCERMKDGLGEPEVVLSCAMVPLANWTNKEREEGWDKRTRITMKKKRSSSTKRAPSRLAIRHGKGRGTSPKGGKKRSG